MEVDGLIFRKQQNTLVGAFPEEYSLHHLLFFEQVIHGEQRLPRSDSGHFILDFSNVIFIDQYGGEISVLRDSLKQEEKELVVVGANDHVKAVLNLVGKGESLTCVNTLDEALNFIEAPEKDV